VFPCSQAEVNAKPSHHLAHEPGLLLDAFNREPGFCSRFHHRSFDRLEEAIVACLAPACFDLDQAPGRACQVQGKGWTRRTELFSTAAPAAAAAASVQAGPRSAPGDACYGSSSRNVLIFVTASRSALTPAASLPRS
jgi:hypothetical protein